MTQYEVARPGDEEEILDFANMVFSQAHRPHDFRALLPKMYAQEHFAHYHVVARQHGRICALVGVFPFELRVMAGMTLSLGYVGTVSVHPYHRGEGHMQKLMPMAVERCRADGIDLMSLGGQRQRYRYFGFEQGGLSPTFTVTQANVRHDFAGEDIADITFVPLAGDQTFMEKASAMHANECMAGVRPGVAFAQALTSWNGQGIGVLRDGEFVGYLYTVHGGIGEWVLHDDAMIGPVLKAFMREYHLEEVRISVPAHEPARIRALDAFAEDCALNDAGMYRILNWPKVLTQLMTFKKAKFGLNPGSASLHIEGEGAFQINVSDDTVQVTAIEQLHTPPISRTQAVGLLLSLPNRLGRREDFWHDWFPLPVSVPQADCF